MRAARLVTGDRARTYGDATALHERVAELWNGYLRAIGQRELGPADVMLMLALMKIGRAAGGSFHLDNYVDGAGYVALAAGVGGK